MTTFIAIVSTIAAFVYCSAYNDALDYIEEMEEQDSI